MNGRRPNLRQDSLNDTARQFCNTSGCGDVRNRQQTDLGREHSCRDNQVGSRRFLAGFVSPVSRCSDFHEHFANRVCQPLARWAIGEDRIADAHRALRHRDNQTVLDQPGAGIGGASVEGDHSGPRPNGRRLVLALLHVSRFFLAFGCGESDVERNTGWNDLSG